MSCISRSNGKSAAVRRAEGVSQYELWLSSRLVHVYYSYRDSR